MQIIGCGNPDRGDDGAGVLVAQRLRDLGVEAEIHTGDALALIERWGSQNDVIVVDAIVSGAPLGTVRVWHAPTSQFPGATAVSTHGFDLGKAIELARALGRLPARLQIYGIEGRQFDPGAGISPEVEPAIELVVRQIKEKCLPHKDVPPKNENPTGAPRV